MAKPNYLSTMKNFALQQPSEDWMILEFSQLGFIGVPPPTPHLARAPQSAPFCLSVLIFQLCPVPRPQYYPGYFSELGLRCLLQPILACCHPSSVRRGCSSPSLSAPCARTCLQPSTGFVRSLPSGPHRE